MLRKLGRLLPTVHDAVARVGVGQGQESMPIMLAVNIEGDVGPGCNLLKWAMPMAPRARASGSSLPIGRANVLQSLS